MQKYKIDKTLGDGAFGTVYKAINTKTGQVVAIKKMKQKYATWNECIELREIKSLRKLNHPYIIKLKQVLHVSEELYMVFEYLDYNLYDVYSKMKNKGSTFTESQIKSMMYQILGGLAHMHKNGFFHRDMKPQNLLFYNNVVKVCDMGLAREIRSRPPYTDYVSTRWYRAPQLLLRSTNYNSPVDIFALGCIMAELYTLSPLFAGANEVDQLNKIAKVLGTPEKSDWPEGFKLAQAKGYYFPQEKGVNLAQLIPNASLEAIDLIQSMLKYSSRKRPTALEALKHEYFIGVKLPEVEAPNRQIVFEDKPTGHKLDTTKEDKKIDQFRATKEKFKQTRMQEAMQNNVFNHHHHNHENSSKGNDLDDLDSLIRELEDKGKKKKDNGKLPFISTKEKFHSKPQKELRESKTELKHGEPYKHIEKEDWKFMRHEGSSYQKKGSSYKYNNSRKGADSKKFAYNFQPAFNPVFLPSVKTPQKQGVAHQHLPRPKPLLPGPAIYKY